MRGRRRVVILVVVVLLLAIPAGSWASHRFNDVPDSNVFHNDITWLADAGVTKGCNPPDNTEFCPSDGVTREQMSAFMRRFAQYIGAEDGTPAFADTAGDADTVDGSDAADFLGAADKAADAELLDGMDSTSFLQTAAITTTTGGSAWLEHNSPPTTVNRFVSGTTVSGDGNMVLGLTAPTQFGTTAYGLHSVEICHDVTSPGFVNSVSLFRTDSATSRPQIFNDGTDKTTDGCTEYTVDRAAAKGIGVIVSLSGGGTVRLEGVTATWTTGANITSFGLTGSTDGNN